MEAELGLCSERKGGNLECNKLLSDGKPKRVNGNGIEICLRCHVSHCQYDRFRIQTKYLEDRPLKRV